ncbi:ABC transporter permease [Bacillus sp. AGMB 02131]|uniref:ABC transporter permease n=1 Tax=Peribacillus faecalis TaxID=2772559 RepID=A0A927CY30_9BACI|nr:ABC transporter permease [Peribacillus faecalis]MBD3108040.1 ABC transporter permease [Peribacillus faecalis]
MLDLQQKAVEDNAVGKNRFIIKNKLAFLDRKIPTYFAPAGILVLIAFWQLVCSIGLVNELTLPSPYIVFTVGIELVLDGTLWIEIKASLLRISLGYLIGCFVGIVVGVLFGISKISERIGMPIVNLLYPIPKIAILPLIMLWLGIGEISKVTVIAIGVFFPIVYNTYMGVSQTSRLLINVAMTFGTNRWDLIRKVILPSSFPMVLSGMRISAGTSLLLLVSAEMVAAQHGIGAFVLLNADLLDISKVLVGVSVLCIIGITINYGLAWLEKKLIPWR